MVALDIERLLKDAVSKITVTTDKVYRSFEGDIPKDGLIRQTVLGQKHKRTGRHMKAAGAEHQVSENPRTVAVRVFRRIRCGAIIQ